MGAGSKISALLYLGHADIYISPQHKYISNLTWKTKHATVV